jgi:hypothetical protein
MDQREWPEPWYPLLEGGEGLVMELQREIGSNHPLAGVRVVAIARRPDTDDVLFLLPEAGGRLAEVHLTWARRRERNPQWPHTVFFGSWEEWAAQQRTDDDGG